MDRAFAKVAAWSEKNNRPLYLGEFGAYQAADMPSRVRWTDYVARAAEKERHELVVLGLLALRLRCIRRASGKLEGAAAQGVSAVTGRATQPDLASGRRMRQNYISGESSEPSQAAASLRTAIPSVNPR